MRLPKPETLGDYFDLQRGTTYKSSLKGFAGPILLGLASIERNGGFRQDKLTTYGGDSPEKLLVRPGELFVSLKDVTQAGDLLGAVARVPPTVPVGRLTQDTVKLVPTRTNPPLAYLYWLLRTPEVRGLCRSRATGTTNLGLAREDFLSIPVPVMTDERARIVELLEAIEDRLMLHGDTNRTLEAMAQALFKSWFIDFDGHDDLVDSEIGPVPRGWEVGPIDEIIEVIGGGTPKRSEPRFWGGSVPWFSVQDAPSLSDVFVLDTEEHITEAGLVGSSARLVPAGTTIISARGTVGKLAVADQPMAFNQSCYGIAPSRGYSHEFVYFLLRSVVAHLQRSAHGSVFDTITRATFQTAMVVQPPVERTRAFATTAGPLLKRIAANGRESSTLTDLRDTLLPKLISGELRVPDAEAAVSEAL